MKTLNVKKTAIATSLFAGAIHIAWIIIVALGSGQALHDYLMRVHMVSGQMAVGPFDAGSAAALVVIALAAGYILGWLFAMIWNTVNK